MHDRVTGNMAALTVALSICTFGRMHYQHAMAQSTVPEERPARPNIIFVMADQLRYQSCGYAGDEKAHTPNLDRLATSGVSFRQAVSATPVCSAYRASLFTGKYTSSTGMVINELRMNTNHTCRAHCLTRAGYETGYIGKWHLYANLWFSLSEDGERTWQAPRFLLANALRPAFGSPWKDYNTSYCDMVADDGKLHLFMSHRWSRAVYLTIKGSDLPRFLRVEEILK